jgi:Pentapeptide repeats (9 copies)
MAILPSRRLKADRIIYLSAQSFNQYRSDLKDIDNAELPTLTGKASVARDLRNYSLDGLVFFGLIFDGSTFGRLSNAKFIGCTFKRCHFASENLALDVNFGGGSLDEITFFECTFDKTNFSGTDLRRVRFREPRTPTVPEFNRCRVSDYVQLSQETLSPAFLVNFTKAIFLPDCRLVLSGEYARPVIDWESVRTIAKLPFLQISLVGVVVFSFLAILLQGIKEQISFAQKNCKAGTDEYSAFGLQVARVCDWLLSIPDVSVLSESILFFFFNCVILFAAAIVQNLKCPPEVLEFSRANWENFLRRPPETYSLLAQQNRFWFWLSAVLYTVSLSSLILRTLSAVYSIARVGL